MKHIKFTERFSKLAIETFGANADTFIYPVGKHINLAILFIDSMLPHLLKEIGDKHINLFVRGSSGAILGALLAKSVKNPTTIYYIKKDGEDRHGGDPGLFTEIKDGVNIILDDFISSGNTINSIYKKISPIISKIDGVIVIDGPFSEWCLDFKPNFVISDASMEDVINEENNKLVKVEEELALVTF